MRLLIKYGLLSFTLAILLNVGGILAARQAGTPEEVAIFLPDTSDPQECPAPCWAGINTDELDHAETVERIMALPQAEGWGLLNWRFAPQGQNWSDVRLENGRELLIRPAELRLGDVLAALGLPDYQVEGYGYDTLNQRGGLYVQWVYKPQGFAVAALLGDEGRLLPGTPLRQVAYLPAIAFIEAEEEGYGHEWQGYIWMRNYPVFGFSPSLTFE
jgi:hypothetical protein